MWLPVARAGMRGAGATPCRVRRACSSSEARWGGAVCSYGECHCGLAALSRVMINAGRRMREHGEVPWPEPVLWPVDEGLLAL